MEIKIYGKPNCQWCTAAKDLLDRKGIEYEYDNLFDMEYNEYQSIIASSGMKTLPIVKVGEIYIGGYDQLEAYVSGKEKNGGF